MSLRSLALVLTVAVVALGTPASAAGPGGWDHLGTGATATAPALNGAVFALNGDAPGALLVGGAFTNAGADANADYIAGWNGQRWQALGAPALTRAVQAIAVRGSKVYVGGLFTDAGGKPDADFVAVWDGRAWAPACTGPPLTEPVNALEIVGSTLYVGGTFRDGAGIASADFLLACDVNTGAPRSTVGSGPAIAGGPVLALAADSRGVLYAGGAFLDVAGNPAADRVAYLDGSGWHALGNGGTPSTGALTGLVRSLATSGTNVYVGTDSTNIAGIAQADHVARWNGSAWSAMGSNTSGSDGWLPASGFVYALATSGSRVFVGGTFLNANGDPRADTVAVFDGGSWQPLGSNGAGDGPLTGNMVSALATFGGQLYAGGSFSNGGGDPLARFIASFPLSAVGGGGPPTTTTTTPTGGAAPPATGRATGTVLLNGRPFTSGQVAYNSTVDVTRGRITLRTDTGTVTVNGAGGVTAAFVLARGTDRGRAVVELRLARGNFAVCPRRRTRSASQVGPTRMVRQIWSNARGRFRTRGRYAVATVRGTNWLTADRCDGTQTRVRQGVVQVSDLPRRRQVTVRAGGSYLARP